MDPAIGTQSVPRQNGGLSPAVEEHMEIQASDQLWPLRPRPWCGELFSSWLVRVARCYEMPVETFCRTVWPAREVWRGDVDRQIDDEALRFLSSKTGVAYTELFSMTLRAHEQYAGAATGDESARDLFVHFGNTDVAIRYCPGCLAERPPYYRLDWRLAFVTVCGRHRLPLLVRCENCKAACLFAHVDVHRSLGSCHYCHRDLAGMGKNVTPDMELQIELHLEFQQTVLNLLRKPQSIRP
jgi:TniQ